MIFEKDIDIALVTESLPKFQSPDLNEPLFNIEGYDSIENKSGRGVVIYYKSTLEIKLHEDINCLYSPSLFFKVSNTKNQVNLAVIYRSPNISKEQDDKLNVQIHQASKKLKNLVLYGDFNHPEIDWENSSCVKCEDHPASKFLHLIQDIRYQQLINEFTHYKPNCRPSLIDLILTNNTDLPSQIKLYPPLGKSHHTVVLSKLSFKKENFKSERIKKYQLNKGNYSAINLSLSETDWDSLIQAQNEDVNAVWTQISSRLLELRNNFIPVSFIKTQNSPRRPDVLNNSLIHIIRDKRWLYKKFKRYRSQTNYNNYCLARSRVNFHLRKAKRNRELIISKDIKSSPKKFYQYIASKTSKKDNIPDLVTNDGLRVKSDIEKANVLNLFFNSVFTKEKLDHIPEFEYQVKEDNFVSESSVTELEMKNYLLNLKSEKSPGTDELHPRLLKECASTLARPLKMLFDLTMKTGTIPDDWKRAEIRPIYKKKGKKTDPSNYRPVSLTSVVCKVFEKIIKATLSHHLTSNNLLSPHQFGFISGRCTNTQLLVTLQQWQKYLDNDVPTDIAYMDFRKAFDAVPHERLLYKLNRYGINGKLHNWIRSFLTSRTQYVKINNSKSPEMPVSSGVPQGSVLGPMLFIYYINDLPEVCTVETKIYADDTKAFTPIKEDNDRIRLQDTIDKMYEWTDRWQLHFNETKCKILHVGKHNPKHTYFIGNGNSRTALEETILEKDLGILVDPNLNFEEHIEHIIKRANSKKAQILNNFTFRSKKVLTPLFKSLVRPILEYNNTVWVSSYRKQIDLVESVQRSYTKHILEVKKFPYEERLKRLQLPSLEYRCFRGDLIQTYKIAHNIYDKVSVSSLFKFNSSSRLRGHNFKITKISTNKRLFQHFFTNRVVNEWNKLHEDIVNSNTVDIFKNKIDKNYQDIMYKTHIFQ